MDCNLQGKVINHWTLVKEGPKSKKKGNYHKYWYCRCSCGSTKLIYIRTVLKNESTKCLDCQQKSRRLHNLSKSKTYSVWCQMKARCENPNHPWYKNYGAKGITVCERWKLSFLNFLDDMGIKPDGFSIERIDNYKGYEKSNCRWATKLEQDRNKRNSIRVGDVYSSWKVSERLENKKYKINCINCGFEFVISSCNLRRKKPHFCGDINGNEIR